MYTDSKLKTEKEEKQLKQLRDLILWLDHATNVVFRNAC